MVYNESGNIIKFKSVNPRTDAAEKSSADSMPRVSAGLALGSGAVRGFAHIGVISELVKNGVTVNMLSGSSMGAIVACLYAGGMNLKAMAEAACEISSEVIFDKRIPFVSLNRGAKLKKFLKRIFRRDLGLRRLEQLKTNVCVVCADINKGRPVIFNSGDIVDALMASAAVPMLFPPYQYSGATYIDGGVLMPLPAGIIRKRLNGGTLIGVSVGYANMIKQPRHILHVSAQSIIMMGEKLLQAQKKEPDILIEPDFGDIGFWAFSRIADIIEAGKKAAVKAMPLILKRNAPPGGFEGQANALNINAI